MVVYICVCVFVCVRACFCLNGVKYTTPWMCSCIHTSTQTLAYSIPRLDWKYCG